MNEIRRVRSVNSIMKNHINSLKTAIKTNYRTILECPGNLSAVQHTSMKDRGGNSTDITLTSCRVQAQTILPQGTTKMLVFQIEESWSPLCLDKILQRVEAVFPYIWWHKQKNKFIMHMRVLLRIMLATKGAPKIPTRINVRSNPTCDSQKYQWYKASQMDAPSNRDNVGDKAFQSDSRDVVFSCCFND